MVKKTKTKTKRVKMFKQKQTQNVIVNIHEKKVKRRQPRKHIPRITSESAPTYAFRTNDAALPTHFQMPTIPIARVLPIINDVKIPMHIETQTDLPFVEAGHEPSHESSHSFVDDREVEDREVEDKRISIKIGYKNYILKDGVEIPEGKFFNTETGRFNKIPIPKKPPQKNAERSPFK